MHHSERHYKMHNATSLISHMAWHIGKISNSLTEDGLQPNTPMSQQTDVAIRKAMCPKSGGNVKICLHCGAMCKAGKEAAARVALHVLPGGEQATGTAHDPVGADPQRTA